MKTHAAARLGALELMQAMQIGHAVAALHSLGVMDALHRACAPAELARQFGIDAALLTGLLDHAARATDLVERRGRRYRATPAWDDQARFLVGLYGSAFGALTSEARTILRQPARGAALVDREQHAAAFCRSSGSHTLGVLPGLLRQLQLQRILDIGCGPATLLLEMAHSDNAFQGWGIEANPRMRAAARAAIRHAGLSRRVKLIAGDARQIEAAVAPAVARKVQAVVASQFINEMFGAGVSLAVDWLGRLRGLLPGGVLVISDYYGRLASSLPADTLTLVHDHVQLLSGQGLPPQRRQDWIAMYRAAGCRLVHALEDTQATRFIHIVAL